MNLQQREKFMLKAGIFLLIPLLFYNFVFKEIVSRYEKSQTEIENLSDEIQKFDLIGQEFQYLRRLNVRRPRVELGPLVTRIVSEEQISESPETIDVGENTAAQRVQVRFKKLRTDELTAFVYQLENNIPVILIEKIDVERSFGSKSHVSASMILVAER